jgi:hypothetical protein
LHLQEVALVPQDARWLNIGDVKIDESFCSFQIGEKTQRIMDGFALEMVGGLVPLFHQRRSSLVQEWYPPR